MDTPTTVQLANGSSYVIPSGSWGTWAWARQAALIRDAYKQLGDSDDAATWDTQYDRRAAIYNALEAGKDRASVVLQFGEDLVTAPFKILQDLGNTVTTIGAGIVKPVTDTLALLPVVVIGGVALLLVLASKGQLAPTIQAVRRRR